MKYFLIAALSTVILLALLIPTAGATCGMNNPLLEELVNSGEITPFESPVKVEGACGGLWETPGSCCPLEAAVKWTNNDALKIDTATGSFMQAYQELKVLVATMLENSKESHSQFAFLNTVDLSFLENLLKDSQIKKMDESIKVCWDHMKKARKSSMCYICSGASSEFLLHDKIAIGMGQCDSMLKGCKFYFRDTISLLQGISKLVNSIRSNLKITITDTSPFNWLEEFETILKSENLVALIEDVTSKVSSQESIKSSERLCNKYFKLVKRPFIEDLVPLIVGLKTNLNSILQMNFGRSLRLWRPVTRKMLLVDSLSTFNEVSFDSSADSIIINSESVFSTEISKIGHHGKEANLTLALLS